MQNRFGRISNNKMIDIQLLDSALSVQTCDDFVAGPDCGGLVTFVGTVRNQTKGKTVQRLDFEAYKPMAIAEMQKIAKTATDRWPVHRIAIHHRVGMLQIGEIAVIISVACAHRKAAFEACQFAIDTLKETVPIWKKEIFEDGEVWVAAHP
jgi:molybdopterin synthase catalytic subunit